MWETHTLPVYTLALVIAAVRTLELAAVVPSVALMAHTLPVHATAIVVTVFWAGGHRAVRPFPSRVTEAAARVVLVCPVAATARVHTLGTNAVKRCLSFG